MTLGRCLAFLGTGHLTADVVQHVGLYTVKAEMAPGPEVETEGSYWVSQNVWVFLQDVLEEPKRTFWPTKSNITIVIFFLFYFIFLMLFFSLT